MPCCVHVPMCGQRQASICYEPPPPLMSSSPLDDHFAVYTLTWGAPKTTVTENPSTLRNRGPRSAASQLRAFTVRHPASDAFRGRRCRH
eukprot:341727-Prymnesium_polylepis.1